MQPTWQTPDGSIRLYLGDCRDVLPTPPTASVDCVVTDPPYAEISRDYGRLTEPQWHALMDVVVPECRRLLTPTGSAVFVLQPNSERVGRMRPWLWEFMAKWTREWGMVQDAYWWNYAALPNGGATNRGMLRASVKSCVWLGCANCYRDQDAVLWSEAEYTKAHREGRRSMYGARKTPSGNSTNEARMAAAVVRRGGVTPFNLIPVHNGSRWDGPAAHGARTPHALCDWWLRYICPPAGTVLDPFMGSGTVALAAMKRGLKVIGCEKEKKYFDVQVSRIEAELAKQPLLEGVA